LPQELLYSRLLAAVLLIARPRFLSCGRNDH
jgi:hypothetical protein